MLAKHSQSEINDALTQLDLLITALFSLQAEPIDGLRLIRFSANPDLPMRLQMIRKLLADLGDADNAVLFPGESYQVAERADTPVSKSEALLRVAEIMEAFEHSEALKNRLGNRLDHMGIRVPPSA